jgi:hypothetical protein
MKKNAIVIFLIMSINCSLQGMNRRSGAQGAGRAAWERRGESASQSLSTDQRNWLNEKQGTNRGGNNRSGGQSFNSGARNRDFF